jgi:phospholipase C
MCPSTTTLGRIPSQPTFPANHHFTQKLAPLLSTVTRRPKLDRLGRNHHRLHPSPCVVSVLRFHSQSETHAASVGCRDRACRPANHGYDLEDFYAAVKAGNFPAVSFIKAQAYQDGHAGYSDPLDEQTFLVTLINFLQKQPTWSSTAVVVLYDDSDGWYDHQMGPIVNTSSGSADALTGLGLCGNAMTALPGVDPMKNPHAFGRCGYGPRQPLLVVSPWAKQNFVDHTVTDQTSVLRFIEDNWLGGQRIGQGSFDSIASSINQIFNFAQKEVEDDSGKLLLDPATGEPIGRGDE